MIEKAGWRRRRGERSAVKILPRVIHVGEERERPRRDTRVDIEYDIPDTPRRTTDISLLYSFESDIRGRHDTFQQHTARLLSSTPIHAFLRTYILSRHPSCPTLAPFSPFAPPFHGLSSLHTGVRQLRYHSPSFPQTRISDVDVVGCKGEGKIEAKIEVSFSFLFLQYKEIFDVKFDFFLVIINAIRNYFLILSSY